MTTHVSFEGVKTVYVYNDSLNGSGQLIEKQFFTADNVTLTPNETFTYEYDEQGREIRVTQTLTISPQDARVNTQTYNGKGELIQIASPEGIVNYEYDAYGRKIRTYTGDPADPVTDTLYTYDELGRLATVSVVERNDVTLSTPETTRYEYDLVGNRLVQIAKLNGKHILIGPDSLGNELLQCAYYPTFDCFSHVLHVSSVTAS